MAGENCRYDTGVTDPWRAVDPTVTLLDSCLSQKTDNLTL